MNTPWSFALRNGLRLGRRGPDLRAFRHTDGQPPRVDGDLTKPFWWYRTYIDPRHTFYSLRDLFTGVAPAHVSTSVSFRYTDGALFIGIECLEPKMERIQARCTANDHPEIWSGDFVEIRLEMPNGRQPRIVVNPNGTVHDSDPALPKAEDLPHFYRVTTARAGRSPTAGR